MSVVAVERALASISPFRRTGRLTRAVGLEIEVRGIAGAIGDLVDLGPPGRRILSEVVALADGATIVMPLGDADGLATHDPAELRGGRFVLPLSSHLAGRVIDAFGQPIDDLGPVPGPIEKVPLDVAAPHPLERGRIDRPCTLGVRVIDALLPCGRGQRVGVFAGSGVGKSTLLGMMARGSSADAVVVALIGERGREVREFLEDDLGPEGRRLATVVVATSDEPAMVRMRAAYTATRIAEWHAAQGKDVLLLLDSLTRVAMAQREIGLAAGEPPTTRGYPPSVFAMLPKLLERTGPHARGSITAIYTVLVEGDDLDEPITDHARSILDGHYVLSRRLAGGGHFPAIDVPASASRLVGKILTRDEQAGVVHVRSLISALDEARDLLELGAYVPGTNATIDEALMKQDRLQSLARQDSAAVTSWNDARRAIEDVVAA
jgi:flagellum-specific ATP synthase